MPRAFDAELQLLLVDLVDLANDTIRSVSRSRISTQPDCSLHGVEEKNTCLDSLTGQKLVVMHATATSGIKKFTSSATARKCTRVQGALHRMEVHQLEQMHEALASHRP